MPRIPGWSMIYWINAKGEREKNPQGLDTDDATLAIYENERGEQVEYRYADEEAEHKYEVLLNGELVEGVEIGGEHFDEEELDEWTFGTRADARNASTYLMRQLPPVTDDDAENHKFLKEQAMLRGHPGNLSTEEYQDIFGVEPVEEEDEAEAEDEGDEEVAEAEAAE